MRLGSLATLHGLVELLLLSGVFKLISARYENARTLVRLGLTDGADDSSAFVHADSAAAAVAVVNNEFEKARRLIMVGPSSGNNFLMCYITWCRMWF